MNRATLAGIAGAAFAVLLVPSSRAADPFQEPGVRDNLPAFRDRLAARLTSPLSWTHGTHRDFDAWRSAIGNSMLSSAESQGNRLASWNTTPTRSGSGASIGRPWMWIVPAVWWRRPAIIISSEVLPQPLGPTITTKRPELTVIAMSAVGAAVLSLLWSANAAWLLVCTTTGMYLNYEFFHWCCHVNDDGIVRHIPFVNTIRRHHIAHHNQAIMMDKNMNLTYPIADWLFGTSDLNRGLLGHVFNGYSTRYVKSDLKRTRPASAAMIRPSAAAARA